MVVYIENVLIDNLVIDFLLLALARKSYKLPVKFLRLILPSVVGAAVALALPVMDLGNGWLFLLRLALSLFMVAISGKFRNLKEYIFCYYLFIFYTLLFGGAVSATFYLFGIKYDPLTGINAADFPLGFALGVCSAVYFAAVKVIKAIYKRRDITRFTVDCSLSLGGESFALKGFIDSGNRLVYKKTGSPIILCSPSAAKKVFFGKDFSSLSLGDMEINTVTGKSFIKLYKTEKLLIYSGDSPNIINNVVIGLSERDFDAANDYDLILNPILV